MRLARVSLARALRTRVRLHTLAALAAAAALTACGDDHGDDTPHDPDGHGDTIGCQDDARAVPYTDDLSVTARSGDVRFVLTDADPTPPAQGLNRWTVRLIDADGEPVTDVTLSAEPFMPDHGHGPTREPTVTASGDSFVIDELDLFMPGLWRITLRASDGDSEEVGELHLCIEG